MTKNPRFLLFCVLFVLGFSPPLEGKPSLPLPRMASLKASEVNLRVGPGRQYPIIWTLLCLGLPVEITSEFDTWRQIRDPFGSKGWIHQSMLAGRKTLFVLKTIFLYSHPQKNARKIARLGKGLILDLRDSLRSSDSQDWYSVKIKTYKGFVRAKDCWPSQWTQGS
jgi:SH3-like domain-containing protein